MLYVFDQYQDSSLEKVIRIGSIESLWRVLDYERIITGEYLFTLKARHALGVLPELNAKEIPEIGREKAVELFEKLVDSAHRESASSIVDIARAFCQWCLSTRRADERGDCSLLKCDLGDIIKKFESEQDRDKVILSAARIIARLHSRVKPNEQARHSTRSVSEADAEFALATIGLILRDFGWVV
jgi:hypothetical protein